MTELIHGIGIHERGGSIIIFVMEIHTKNSEKLNFIICQVFSLILLLTSLEIRKWHTSENTYPNELPKG